MNFYMFAAGAAECGAAANFGAKGARDMAASNWSYMFNPAQGATNNLN